MNRKRWLASATLGVLIVTTALPAMAQVQELEPDAPAPIYYTDEMIDETPRGWFVEFEGAPTIEGGSAATLKQGRDQFRGNAKKQKIQFEERFEFESLFNGISIWTDASQIAAISRLPGVKAIYPVIDIDRPEVVEGGEPDLFTALSMTGADIVQSELGFTGKGIKVAVMDTGVDYHHPDLGGGFGRGYKVAYGYDFVGDAFNADPDDPNYNPVPVPDRDPDDCAIAGHGTHVAGIVGANGTVKGVAPEVTLGAYRVFGCEGSTTADVMIAAMERAQRDGMDVLNMSIGSAFQWPQYPTAVAADRLVKRGMVVVASIGNSGANGLYAAGAPGLGERVIGVASFDNSHATLNTFVVSDGTSVGFTSATASPLPPTEGFLDIASADQGVGNDLACAPLPEGSLEGVAALVQRGTCTFYEKALNAQNAGAAAVLLYNNAPGRINPTVAGEVPITIPVVAITNADGVAIRDLLADGGEASLEWTDEVGTFPSPTGGLISDFSSYGLSPDLALKPDIGAPGGGIYSTYPLEAGGYATLGGTSMSSPHVAGAAALFLEARPKTRPETIRAIFQNTADPKFWWGNPGLGFLDSVHRQGAGMLQIDKAIESLVTVEDSKIALGEMTADRPSLQTLTVRNNSGRRITYALSHEEAISNGGSTYSPSFMIGDDQVEFDKETITLSPRGSTKIRVSIAPDPDLPDGTLFGGYITLTPVNNDGPILRVPYAGYKGDYQEKVALAPTVYGFPWLASLSADGYSLADEGTSFTMADGDLPYVLFHLDHHVSRFQVGVREAAEGSAVAYFVDEEYMGRNSTAAGFFAVGFDGIVLKGKREVVLPDGDYVFEIKVLKALGNPRNPDHWETWTSPAFVIDRTAE